MRVKKIPHRNLRKSSLGSFAIEGMKPSEATLTLADKVLERKISKEEAIALICSKYKTIT